MFFAFFKGWYFSCVLLAYFPFMFTVAFFSTVGFASGYQENLRAYGQSAGYAEQALNAIKIVFAFGQEKTEISNYQKYLDRAKKMAISTHLKAGAAAGALFAGVYGYYAYSFYFGSIFIYKQKENTNSGANYTAGDIFSCFLGVIYGMVYIGMATPNFKAITEGKISGKMAYDVILRKPEIDLDQSNSKKLTNFGGEIEFKNVTFSYPTR